MELLLLLVVFIKLLALLECTQKELTSVDIVSEGKEMFFRNHHLPSLFYSSPHSVLWRVVQVRVWLTQRSVVRSPSASQPPEPGELRRHRAGLGRPTQFISWFLAVNTDTDSDS